MTFGDLEHCIGEDVMLRIDDSAAIAAEVSKLLSDLEYHDIFVVRRLAKDIRAAIASEFAFNDGDMVEVVRRLGAVLEPMIHWLERHGVKDRSLRQRGRSVSA